MNIVHVQSPRTQASLISLLNADYQEHIVKLEKTDAVLLVNLDDEQLADVLEYGERDDLLITEVEVPN